MIAGRRSSRRVHLGTMVIAGLIAGCTPEPPSDAGTVTSTAPGTTAPAPAVLRYGFTAGDQVTYEVVVSQEISFRADGDAPSFGDSELPISADLGTAVTSEIDQVVTAGPRAETERVAIGGEFPDVAVTGTVNGEEITDGDTGGIQTDLARIGPVETVFVVNERGEILDPVDDGSGVTGADLTALAGLTDDLLSDLLGPVFPLERALGVGDVWEYTSTRGSPAGPISADSRAEIVEFDGTAYTIETTTEVDGYEVDFSEQFRALFRDLGEADTGEDAPDDAEALLDRIRFTIDVDGSTATETTRFDPASGYVVEAERTGSVGLVMVFRSPDPETGAVTGFRIELDIVQTARFRLLDGP